MSQALLTAQALAAAGEHNAETVLQAAAEVLARNNIEPEYLALVDAETFLPIDVLGAGPAVLAVAADLGGTRLIDNVLVEAVLIDPVWWAALHRQLISRVVGMVRTRGVRHTLASWRDIPVPAR